MATAPILSMSRALAPVLVKPISVPIVPAQPPTSTALPTSQAIPTTSTAKASTVRQLGPGTATVTPGGPVPTSPAQPSGGTAPIVPAIDRSAAGKRIKVDLRRGKIGLGTTGQAEPVPMDLPQSWLLDFSSEAFWANDIFSSPVTSAVNPLLAEAWRRMVGMELAKVGLAYAVLHSNLIIYRTKYEDMIVRLRNAMNGPTTTAGEKQAIFDLVRRMMLELQQLEPTIDRLQAVRDGRAFVVLADHRFGIMSRNRLQLPEEIQTVDYSGLGMEIGVVAAVIVVAIGVALVSAAVWGIVDSIEEPKRLDSEAQHRLVAAQAEGLRLLTEMARNAENRGDTQTAAALLSQQQPYFQQDIAALAAARAQVAQAEEGPSITTALLYLGVGYLALEAIKASKH